MPKDARATKLADVEIWVTIAQKKRWQEAARRAGWDGLSGWIRDACDIAARQASPTRIHARPFTGEVRIEVRATGKEVERWDRAARRENRSRPNWIRRACELLARRPSLGSRRRPPKK